VTDETYSSPDSVMLMTSSSLILLLAMNSSACYLSFSRLSNAVRPAKFNKWVSEKVLQTIIFSLLFFDRFRLRRGRSHLVHDAHGHHHQQGQRQRAAQFDLG